MPTNSNQQILFISSFPSRECGIATYSKDLLSYLTTQFSSAFSYTVCALEDNESNYAYTNEVKYKWNVKNKTEYLVLAHKINNDPSIQLLFIQHEFGLFGGHWGDELILFLEAVTKPIVTTFHTILPNPDSKLKKVVEKICLRSQAITVMTQKSMDILARDYSLSNNKISVIPHGTHSTLRVGKKLLKEKHNLIDNLVLSTFGLISPNKSIETALDALPAITEKYPEVKYLVLGKTHPGVVKTEGENYRTFLENKCEELGITNNVIFVNKYLTLDDLLDYLNLTDIYLFTSKDPHQAVSGTFSYARSSGCPLVATNIPHAAEFLNDGSGILIDFENPKQLANAVIELISDPKRRNEMGKIGFEKSLETSWENISIRYASLFRKALNQKYKLKYNLPQINYSHLLRMQTAKGVLRSAELAEPAIASGYSLQENAITAIIYTYQNTVLNNFKFSDSDFDKIISFLEYCQFTDGSLANYLDKSNAKQKISYTENFEKSNAVALWALGELISNPQLNPLLKTRCIKVADKLINWIKTEEITAHNAIAIRGLYKIYQSNRDEKVRQIGVLLSAKLIKALYSSNFYTKKESQIYDEIGVSEALIYAYYITRNTDFKHKAREIFNSWSKNMFYTNDQVKSTNSASFDSLIYPEDPSLVFQLISTLNTFYHAYEDDSYKTKMEIAFNWFLGDNNLKRMMYNPSSGGCYTKMTKQNIDINQNTMPTLAFLLSRLFIEKANKSQKNIKNIQEKLTSQIG